MGAELEGSDDERSESRVEQWLFIFVILLISCFLHLAGGVSNADDPSATVDPDSGSALAQAVWSVVYAGAFVGLWIERRRAWRLVRGSWPIVVLVALICSSSFWSSDPGLTAKRAFGVFGTTAIAYYVACRFSLWTFMKLFGLSTVIGAGLSFMCIVAAPSLGVGPEGAWQGIYIEKNELGEAMSLGIATLLVIALRMSGRRLLYVIGGLALCSVLLVGARSATAIVLVLASGAILALALVWRSKRHVAIARAATLVLALAVIAFASDSAAFLGLLGRDDSFTGRSSIWAVAESAIPDRPLLGYGYGVFWLENDGPYLDYVAQATRDFWLPANAHNGFLQISLDVGLIGAALVVLTLLYGTWCAARYSVKGLDVSSVWPLLVIVAFVVRNFSESSIASYNNLYWVVFVAVFLYAVKPEERLADSSYVPPRRPQLVPGGLFGSQRRS